jgi:hypothetical protein
LRGHDPSGVGGPSANRGIRVFVAFFGQNVGQFRSLLLVDRHLNQLLAASRGIGMTSQASENVEHASQAFPRLRRMGPTVLQCDQCVLRLLQLFVVDARRGKAVAANLVRFDFVEIEFLGTIDLLEPGAEVACPLLPAQFHQ